MEPCNKKPIRIRRTDEDLNDTLLLAAKDEILKNGFENTTITNVLKSANIQINVFYRRYNSLNDLFDKLIRPYDYWLEDNLKFEGDNPSERVINALNNLIDSINGDPFMQQILLWEVCSDNYLTRRITTNRDLYFNHCIDRYFDKLNSKMSELHNLSSFIVGGIYYFFVTRHKSNQTALANDISILKKQIQSIIIGISLCDGK